MNTVLGIVGFDGLGVGIGGVRGTTKIGDLGLVHQIAVEAEHLLILGERGEGGLFGRGHLGLVAGPWPPICAETGYAVTREDSE